MVNAMVTGDAPYFPSVLPTKKKIPSKLIPHLVRSKRSQYTLKRKGKILKVEEDVTLNVSRQATGVPTV